MRCGPLLLALPDLLRESFLPMSKALDPSTAQQADGDREQIWSAYRKQNGGEERGGGGVQIVWPNRTCPCLNTGLAI